MGNAPATVRQADRSLAHQFLPILMLVVLGALWGANPTFSKALGQQGLSPFGVVFWQTFIAGLILAAICLVRRVPIPLHGKALA